MPHFLPSTRTFFRRTWHFHLSTIGIVLATVILTAGADAGIRQFIARGGFHRSAPPPVIRIYGGPRLPSSWSLRHYIVRIHNQGYSSSCVGQTLSTIAEIDAAEHGRRQPRSAGYIYDQINGGRDAGSTYQAAFGVLTQQGDATLKAFPHDGQDWWVQPDAAAYHSARGLRFRRWRSIQPWDRHTIEAELHAGRAIAFAIPVRDTFYYWNGQGFMTHDTGNYHFDHSITAYGYTPQGLRILNSWGPGWANHGTAIMSWQLVARDTSEMIASLPPEVRQRHAPKRRHPRNRNACPCLRRIGPQPVDAPGGRRTRTIPYIGHDAYIRNGNRAGGRREAGTEK